MANLSVKNFISTYYDTRIVKRGQYKPIDKETQEKRTEEVSKAVKEFVKTHEVVAQVSISKEGREKLMGEQGIRMMEEGIDLLYKNVDKSDLFALRQSDRWMVFDDYLKYSGAYDQIPADRKTVCEAMKEATLNSRAMIGKYSYSLVEGRQLDSSEVTLLFESSMAALQKFSDTFLQGDVKKGFDELIENYSSHMNAHLDGYRSWDESFNRAFAYGHSDLKTDQMVDRYCTSKGVPPENRKMFSIRLKLGAIDLSNYQKKRYQEFLQQALTKIGKENSQDTLADIKKQYVSYATGYCGDKIVEEYIQERSQWALGSVEKTWNKIIDLCQS